MNVGVQVRHTSAFLCTAALFPVWLKQIRNQLRLREVESPSQHVFVLYQVSHPGGVKAHLQDILHYGKLILRRKSLQFPIPQRICKAVSRYFTKKAEL